MDGTKNKCGHLNKSHNISTRMANKQKLLTDFFAPAWQKNVRQITYKVVKAMRKEITRGPWGNENTWAYMLAGVNRIGSFLSRHGAGGLARACPDLLRPARDFPK